MNRTTPKYLGLKLVIPDDSLLMLFLSLGVWSGYDVSIDWGDGTIDTYTGPGGSGSQSYSHQYPSTGTYYLKLYSTSNVIPPIFKGIEYNDNNYNWYTMIRRCVTEIYNATIPFESARWNFKYCTNLTKIDWGLFNYNTTLEDREYFIQCPLTGNVPKFVLQRVKGNTGQLFKMQNNLTGKAPLTPGDSNLNSLFYASKFYFGNDTGQGSGYNYSIASGITSMSDTFSFTGLVYTPQIPNTVTSISSCFWGCSSLTTVRTIPDSVTSMVYTFYQCRSLQSLPALPSRVANISYCFQGCSSATNDMTNYVIPSTVTNMEYTFYGCSNLTGSVPQLPNILLSMNSAFKNCTALDGTIQNLPTNCPDMEGAFANCSGLVSEIPALPTTVTDLDETFLGCNQLYGNIPTIPSTVRQMLATFYSCEQLTGDVPQLPNEITNLTRTFYCCSALDGTITNLPTSCTDMYETFSGCCSLPGPIPALPPNLQSMYGAFSWCDCITGTIPAIPSTVTNIENAFAGCSALTGSTPALSANVVNAKMAFYGCNALDGTIGAIDTNIAADFTETFYECSNLTGNAPPLWDSSVYPNVTQPEPGNSNGCFYGCTSLSNYNDIPTDWK